MPRGWLYRATAAGWSRQVLTTQHAHRIATAGESTSHLETSRSYTIMASPPLAPHRTHVAPSQCHRSSPASIIEKKVLLEERLPCHDGVYSVAEPQQPHPEWRADSRATGKLLVFLQGTVRDGSLPVSSPLGRVAFELVPAELPGLQEKNVVVGCRAHHGSDLVTR